MTTIKNNHSIDEKLPHCKYINLFGHSRENRKTSVEITDIPMVSNPKIPPPAPSPLSYCSPSLRRQGPMTPCCIA
ncbi:hypothetical protein KKF84_19405 [Myxococcota bacterium]|nr:hypothetical protein [Myxococcota bacterium]